MPKKGNVSLKVGTTVDSEKFSYKIDDILGEGGFGCVYLVQRSDDAKFAMKTELCDVSKVKDRLKIEMAVFQDIDRVPQESRKKHFISLVDRGRTEEFKFIVMNLVGMSIDSLRKNSPGKKIERLTTFKIGLQTLEGLGHLHSIGYLHRDLKPHNFAIGRPPNEDIVYVIDFGIARRYIYKDGRLRVPRQHVQFLGTAKYAARNCHNCKEQSRKDDIESWAYVIMDLLDKNNLTWDHENDRNKIVVLKDRVFADSDGLPNMPCGFRQILTYINILSYTDEPDYVYIADIIKKIAKKEDLDLNGPLVFSPLAKEPAKKKDANRTSQLEDDNLQDKMKQKSEAEKKGTVYIPPLKKEDDDDVAGSKKKKKMNDKCPAKESVMKKPESPSKYNAVPSEGRSRRKHPKNAAKLPPSKYMAPPASECKGSKTPNAEAAITVNPSEVKWDDTSVEHIVKVTNNSGDRIVFKVKCADQSYHFTPIYAFIENRESVQITVRRMNLKQKAENMTLIVARSAPEERDAKAAIKQIPDDETARIVVPFMHV